MKYINVHYPVRDVSDHASIFVCPKNNVQVVVTTGDENCDSCLRPLDGEPFYTHCKRCGDQFREVTGADYSDGFCSVECLRSENADLEIVEDGDVE